MAFFSKIIKTALAIVDNEKSAEDNNSITSVNTSTSGGGSGITYHQTAVIYDALSEGPIEGLVDDGASIKLGGNKAFNYGDKDIVAILDATDVSYVASTGVVTDHNNPSFIDSANTSQGSRDVLIVGGSKRGTINTSIGNTIISGASGFTFASSDVVPDGTKKLLPHIRITGAGPDGGEFTARVTEFINTSAVRVNLRPSKNTTNAVCKLDYVGTVTGYNPSQNKVTITAGGVDTSNTTATLSTPTRTATQKPLAKYDNFLWAFRHGTRNQTYLPTPAGIGSASVAYRVTNGNLDTVPNTGYPTWTSLSKRLGKTDNPPYTGTAGQYSASGSGSMGVSDPSEVDLIRLTFNFPQGLNAYKADGNKIEKQGAIYRISLIYERNGTEHTAILNGDSSYSGVHTKYGYNYSAGHRGGVTSGTAIVAGTKRNFNYIYEFDISKFQPFDNYTIKVERINEVNGQDGDWAWSSSATLTSIENVITDKLSFPYTAYAGVIVDAKDFQSIPRRSYEIRGLKVKVPTNYFPKDEKTGAGLRRTSAAYTRNVTSGADTSAYVDWDGNFRGDKKTFSPSHVNYEPVYTSNPVWIFMDLMTNPRYGLGQHINPDFDFSMIDKYTMYSLAKYCDELVPDGKGGVEPRFECNIYIQKTENAIKILKNFTTTMRSMLIWWNGQVSLGANIQKGAVYTFTKSNVLNGDFTYQGTSTRFRNNQIVVTWNNPDKAYKQDVVTVEDNDDIAKTGKVKTKSVTAFGCTSEGQAIRYGKWHLAGELKEKEICSFETGINGGMLRPGDVINIQDPDLTDIVASGRVTTTSSSTTTVIKTDRDISGFLNQTDNFDLHLIYPSGGAYLSQTDATINSTNYRQGDLVLLDETGAAIDTEAKASNCKDDAGAAVQLTWSEETRIETKPISNFSSSAITVSSAFSSVPNGEVIYTVSGQKADGSSVAGSLKQYMVTSIKENFEEMTFSVSAAEYDVSKFDSIDRGYVIPDIPDVMRPPRDADAVPEPQEVFLEVVSSGQGDIGAENGRDLLVEWQHPTNGIQDPNGDNVDDVYEHLAAYEIAHNADEGDVPGKFLRETISSTNTTSFRIKNLGVTGEIIVRVRTVNSIGVTSSWVQRTIEINEDKLLPQNVPSIGFGLNGGIARGGILSCPININSSNGTVTFASNTYTYTPPNPGVSGISISSGNTAMTTQANFNSLANGETGYLYLDYDGSLSRGTTRTDLLQPVFFQTEETTEDANGVENYFQYATRLGESNEDFVQLSGNVSVSAASVDVSGQGTTFDVSATGFEAGDVIIIGDAGTSRFITTVGHIESNTALSLTTAPTRAYSDANVFRQTLRTSNANDSILASVTNTGGVFSLINFSSGNKGADAFTINGTNENHNFPSSAAGLVTDFSSFTNSYTVNKGTISYAFASSGTTPNTFGLTKSDSNCTSVINSSTGAITVTALAADTASITVTITDRENSETIATRVISLGKSIPGAAGAGTDSRTVNLTADDYSIVYDSSGANPSPSGTITLTATAQNFSTPFFKFTGDGISDEGTYSANGSNTTTDTFTFSVPSTINTAPQTIKVGVAEGNQTELAFDTITLTSLQQGSQGVDGAPAYTAIITNEAHTFPASNTGIVSSFANSGTKIEVYKGATQLTPVANNTTPSTNQYTVTTSATNITPGAFTLNTGSEKNVTVADHSGVANGTDLSEIEYSIDIENEVTLTKAQTFTKSKRGDDGSTGAAGINGLLTNEAASATVGSFYNPTNNTINYSGTGGEFKIFSGASELTSGVVYGISGGTVGATSTTKTQNNLTLTINNSTGVYSLSGGSWDSDIENFTLTGTVTASSVTIEKIYTIDKTNIYARTNLIASEQVFKYNSAGANPSPSTIELRATAPSPFTIFGSYQYKFLKSTDGGENFTTIQALSTDNTVNVSAGAISLGAEVFKVEAYSASSSYGGQYIVDEDELTLLRVQDGATGDTGDSIINIYKFSTTEPDAPDAGTSNPPSGWYSTIATAISNGSGILYVSYGNKPAGSSTITWNDPVRYVRNYGDIGGTKPPEDANKFEKVADSEEGRWRFRINDGSVQDVDVFSQSERTKLGYLRAGRLHDDSGDLESTAGSQNKANTAENNAKTQEETNRFTVPSNTTDGVFSFKIGTSGTTQTYDVLSSDSRTKFDRLRQGQDPLDANQSIRNDGIRLYANGVLQGANSQSTAVTTTGIGAETPAGAQTKANTAETNAKTQEEANRFTVPSNSTDGVFSFKVGTSGSTQTYDVLSSDSRTKFDRLRQGQDPLDNTKSIRNAGVTIDSSGILQGIGTSSIKVNNTKITMNANGTLSGAGSGAVTTTGIGAETPSGAQSKADSAESNAKGQEEANRFTVPTNSTDGVFSFKIGTSGSTQTYDVLSSDSRTKFDRVRQGQDPLDASKSIRNTGITLAANGVLSGGGTSTQVNIGSIAATPFNTSGDVDTGETIAVGSKITIDRDNERILIED